MSGDVRARLRAEIERLSSANAFGALGLGYDAGRADVRAAFLAATKKYHPSRFARLDRDIVKLANEAFLLIKDAYSLLVDDAKRSALREKYAPSAPRAARPRTESGTAGPASARSSAVRSGRQRRTSSERDAAARSGKSARVRGVRVETTRGAGAPQAPAAPATVKGTGVAGRGRIRRPSPPSGGDSRRSRAASQTGLQAVAEAARRTGQARVAEVAAAASDTIVRHGEMFDAAMSLNRAGKHEQARKLLQQIAVESPKDKKFRMYLHFVWGQEHEAAERFDEASAEYRRAINVDPGFKRAHEALGRLETERKGFFKKLFSR